MGFKCEKCGVESGALFYNTKDKTSYCSPCIDKKLSWESDLINNPPHYTKWGIEPIDYTISNNLNFCEWNIIKYVTRYKYKNGKQDLEKCLFYIQRLINDYK